MKTIKLLLSASFLLVSFACSSQEKAGKNAPEGALKLYTCAMHDSVAAKKPGHCPICGMKLELSAKEMMKHQETKSYSCPMHAEVTSDKPGTCSKCGMDLSLSAKEKMKVQEKNNFTCPMHSTVQKKQPGKCPYCGMKLTESKKKATDIK